MGDVDGTLQGRELDTLVKGGEIRRLETETGPFCSSGVFYISFQGYALFTSMTIAANLGIKLYLVSIHSS